MFGYLIISDIQCIYTVRENKLYVIPANKEDLCNLWVSVRDGIDRLEEVQEHGQKRIFHLKNVNLGFENEIIFEIEFMVSVINGYKVNQVIFTCDDLDTFVNPVSIYYIKYKKDSNGLTKNLLYDRDVIKNFKFKALEKIVSGEIVIGDILSSGTGSDLKLHSKLKLSFEETDDYNFIYYLYNIVKKFLQITLYHKDINLSTVKLTGATKSHCFSHIGGLDVKLVKANKASTVSATEYLLIQDYIENYFQLIVDDEKLYVKHLPNENQSIHSIDILRFLNIYSAFENEYSKLPRQYRKKDSTHVKVIKEVVINNLENIPSSSEDNDAFINESKKRIRQIGTQYGERDKIVNAYNIFKPNMDESLNFFFYKGNMDMKLVADLLSKTRDRIVHNNLDRELTKDEVKYISFLECLSYSMLLNRIGLSSSLIQVILGAIFNCNGNHYKYISELKSES